MENLFKKYLRWRHSKGYGVHSPYAYRFVTDVLQPGEYGFYAYHEIDHEFLIARGKHEIDAKSLKLFFRLIKFLDTKRLIVAGNRNKDLLLLGKIANIPVLDFQKLKDKDFRKNDLLIINGSDLSQENLIPDIKAGIPVFAINPSNQLKSLMSIPLERGLYLEGNRRLLLVPRQEMAYTTYQINF